VTITVRLSKRLIIRSFAEASLDGAREARDSDSFSTAGATRCDCRTHPVQAASNSPVAA